MTRLLIDRTRCDGHGSCAELLPELLELDEWGFPVVLSAPSRARPRRTCGARRPRATRHEGVPGDGAAARLSAQPLDPTADVRHRSGSASTHACASRRPSPAASSKKSGSKSR